MQNGDRVQIEMWHLKIGIIYSPSKVLVITGCCIKESELSYARIGAWTDWTTLKADATKSMLNSWGPLVCLVV